MTGNNVKVTLTTTDEVVNFDLNEIKIIAGAYWCQLSEIDFSRVNERLI